MDTRFRQFTNFFSSQLPAVCFMILMLWGAGFNCCEAAQAHSVMNPLHPDDTGIQNLVYGRSTFQDVQNAIGRSPDEIVHSQQMFPVVDNYYYYDEAKTGAATVFVFENNLLVGLQYKSPKNQYIDLTYMIPNIGDREINNALLGGFQSYYFNPQFYTFGR